MKRKQTVVRKRAPAISAERLALLRLDAVRIAAALPVQETHGQGLQGGFHNRPGKTADQVVLDAGKIIAFITA